MGGMKQSYILTYSNEPGVENIYMTFGNGKYAKNILKALGVHYEAYGFQKKLDEKKFELILTKEVAQQNKEMIIFKLYQKQLIWQGQLPENIAFLEKLIPQA